MKNEIEIVGGRLNAIGVGTEISRHHKYFIIFCKSRAKKNVEIFFVSFKITEISRQR